jgi:hypothetical protein
VSRPHPITHARLVADWRRALDAVSEALEAEGRYYSPAELSDLERHVAAERRWLEHFSTIRNFP